jgi:hypothetical protein
MKEEEDEEIEKENNLRLSRSVYPPATISKIFFLSDVSRFSFELFNTENFAMYLIYLTLAVLHQYP